MPQSPGGAAAAFYGWTMGQLILMAVGAAIVIIGMIYGRRLAHQRHRAEKAAENRADEVGMDLPPQGDPTIVETTPEPLARAPDPEPPVAVPEAAAGPASRPAPIAEPAASPALAPNLAGALPLTTIKGLGPKVAAMLAERGIDRVDQIAALSPAEADELDVQLGAFAGRMARDRWIDQAKLLSSGDSAAYEAAFGKLG